MGCRTYISRNVIEVIAVISVAMIYMKSVFYFEICPATTTKANGSIG